MISLINETGFNEEPLASKEKIYSRLKELYPDADEKAMDRLLR